MSSLGHDTPTTKNWYFIPNTMIGTHASMAWLGMLSEYVFFRRRTYILHFFKVRKVYGPKKSLIEKQPWTNWNLFPGKRLKFSNLITRSLIIRFKHLWETEYKNLNLLITTSAQRCLISLTKLKQLIFFTFSYRNNILLRTRQILKETWRSVLKRMFHSSLVFNTLC